MNKKKKNTFIKNCNTEKKNTLGNTYINEIKMKIYL